MNAPQSHSNKPVSACFRNPNEKRRRREFTEDFKWLAVRLAGDLPRSFLAVAEAVNVSPHGLRE
jgi:hypothetical protein